MWLILSVVLFIFELLSPGAFFFACLGIGALICALVVLLEPPFWVTLVVFVAASVLSIYFIRPFAKKYFQGVSKKTNVDAMVGQKAWVTEEINPEKMGMVKIQGELWRAQAHEKIEKDNWVEVLKVDGTHLEVKKS
jgi:membrane protein implicated in regulation of membrane protease activity